MYLRAGGGGTSATSPDLSITFVKLDLAESNFSRVLVDSGTADTHLNQQTAEKFMTQYSKMTGKEYDQHHMNPLSTEQLQNEPSILLQ